MSMEDYYQKGFEDGKLQAIQNESETGKREGIEVS